MTARGPVAAALVLTFAGCAAAPPTPPTPVDPAPVAAPVIARASPQPSLPEPTRVIESPPIEPVDPPPPARPAREPEPTPVAPTPSEQVAVAPPALSVPPVPPAPQLIVAEPTAEEREFGALLADLQRYNALAADELRREIQAMTQAITRGRSDANRVRLAVLYTLTRQTAQDDQRALQLFETVAKSNPASASIK